MLYDLQRDFTDQELAEQWANATRYAFYLGVAMSTTYPYTDYGQALIKASTMFLQQFDPQVQQVLLDFIDGGQLQRRRNLINLYN